MSGIPKFESPAFDLNGRFANLHQNQQFVYFLCQTYENVCSVPRRIIEIPSGHCIFMPIINWISFPDSAEDSDKRLFAEAKTRMDVIGNLELTINRATIEKNLSNLRITSSVFDCFLPEKNIFEKPPGRTRAVSDGYWLFTRPIEEDISLSTFASCSAGVTNIGVIYDVKVNSADRSA